MTNAVRVVGEKEVMDRLGAVGQMLSGRQLLKVVKNGALIVENDAKAKVPKRTGNLMRSLHTEAEMEGATASVQTGTRHLYGAYVEFGTGIFGTGPGASGKPIVVTAKQAKALRWMTFSPTGAQVRTVARAYAKGTKGRMSLAREALTQYAFAKKVTIQGMKPKPYLRPAFDEKKDAALSEMARAGRELIEKVARRG